MSQELLKEFLEVFPMVGASVPYIELKFRYAGKYGLENLDDLLKKLCDDGVLTSFEFAGSLNYKLAKDLPLSMNSGNSNGSMNSDLIKIISTMASKIGDPELISMVDDFSNKYM